MLALAKRGAYMDALTRNNGWGERLAGELPADLFGKTVLIIGFGRIGTRTAKACLALGMTVRVYDPYVDAAAIAAAGCTPERDLDAALPHADFVTIHCPKTPETTGMFDASRLARMRASAYLVNTARGGIIDEARPALGPHPRRDPGRRAWTSSTASRPRPTTRCLPWTACSPPRTWPA